MKLFATAVLALAFAGCTMIQGKAGPYIAKGVNRYCEEPQAARALVRAEVNAALAPAGHEVEVHCAGDE